MAETKNFMAKLVRAWPALPYMALGALLASVYIASSGTAWLSDSETNGGNLSVLTVTTSLSAGGLIVASSASIFGIKKYSSARRRAFGRGRSPRSAPSSSYLSGPII